MGASLHILFPRYENIHSSPRLLNGPFPSIRCSAPERPHFLANKAPKTFHRKGSYNAKVCSRT